MRTFIPRLAIVALFALAVSACDDTQDPLSPTQPSGTITTDTFSGSFRPNGGVTHQFVTTGAGTLQAALLSMTPNTEANDLEIGFGVGVWNGQLCSFAPGLAQDRARVNTTITGTVGLPSTLCVRIWDNGTISEETSYEIRVVHP